MSFKPVRSLGHAFWIYVLFWPAPLLAEVEEPAVTPQANAPHPREVARALFAERRYQELLQVLDPAGDDAEVVLLRAKSLLWTGEVAEAEREVRNATKQVRALPQIRVCLADILFAQNEWVSAQKQLEAVLEADPDHPDAQAILVRVITRRLEEPTENPLGHIELRARLLGFVADENSRAVHKEALFLQLANLQPQRVKKAIALIEREWRESSERESFLIEAERRAQLSDDALQRALKLLAQEPERADLIDTATGIACAGAWSALGDKKPVQARALALPPWPVAKPSCLLVALAQSQLILKNFDAAAEVYATLLKREPNNLDVVFGATEAALSANALDRADRLLIRLETEPEADRARTRNLRLNFDLRSANGQLQRGNYVEAERFARHAMTQGDSPDAFMLLAAALRSSGREADAVATLERAIESSPDVARLYAALGRMPGKFEHAPLAKKALSFPPPATEGERLDLALSLGDAYIQDDELGLAEEAYRAVFEEFPDHPTVVLRLSSVSMRKGDPFSARRLIERVYETSPSFGATLSLADAYHALGLEKRAFRLGQEALEEQPGQPDAERFVDNLEFAHAPTLAVHSVYTWDNGTNRSLEAGVRGSMDVDPEFRLTLDLWRRWSHTVVTNEHATIDNLLVSGQKQLGQRASFSGAAGFGYIRSPGRNGVLPLGLSRLDLRLGTRHRLSIGYEATSFSYTAGMLRDHVGLHTLSYAANGPILGGLSFYMAGSAAYLTDDNFRLVSFNSLYYDFLNNPTVKAGVNGQILAFSSTDVRSYFSPGRLVNVEVFGEVLKDTPDARFLYGALVALGIQRIERIKSQKTFRIGAMLGVRPLRRLKIMAKAQTSNSSSTSVTGFQYYEVGGLIEWTFH